MSKSIIPTLPNKIHMITRAASAALFFLCEGDKTRAEENLDAARMWLERATEELQAERKKRLDENAAEL